MADQELKDLLARLRAFVRERDWEQFHTPKNLSCALVVEAAELLEVFQWSADASASLSPEQVQQATDEIGDVLIYLMLLSDRLHVDPVRAAEGKLAKNASNYPVALSKGSSKKHSEL